jgi:hypothetical protein
VQIVRTKRYLKDLKRLGASKAEAGAIELTIAPLAGRARAAAEGDLFLDGF